MTDIFAQLKSEPQTGVTLNDFSMEERGVVHKLSVSGRDGRSSSDEYVGSFTPVYYVAGDESIAAKKFVEINESALERIDFKRKNVVSTSVSDEMYELILHHLGERVRTIYSTVVREDHKEGTTWLFDRHYYESRPGSRYSIGSEFAAKAPPAVDLRDVFADVGSPIRESALEATGLKGGLKQVLDYYRVDSSFPCQPVTVDDEIALVKE